MSYKIDTLLKKATAFELLSLYGNRKDFLRALAQDWSEVMKEQGDLPEQHNIPAPPYRAPNLPPPPPPTDHPGELSVPETVIPGTVPHQSQMDPETVRLLQTFLNIGLKASIMAGQRGPIAEDGKLGPETMGALKQWAKSNGLGGKDIQSILNTAVTYAKSK